METEIEKCERETGHAQVPGTHFCRCTHAMYDALEDDAPVTYDSLETAGALGEFLPPTAQQTIEYLEAEVLRLAEENRALRGEAEVAQADLDRRAAEIFLRDARIAALEAERSATERVLKGLAWLFMDPEEWPGELPEGVMAIEAAACARIRALEAECVALEAEVETRRRQQDEAAQTLRQALGEQGRLRLATPEILDGLALDYPFAAGLLKAAADMIRERHPQPPASE